MQGPGSTRSLHPVSPGSTQHCSQGLFTLLSITYKKDVNIFFPISVEKINYYCTADFKSVGGYFFMRPFRGVFRRLFGPLKLSLGKGGAIICFSWRSSTLLILLFLFFSSYENAPRLYWKKTLKTRKCASETMLLTNSWDLLDTYYPAHEKNPRYLEN